MNIFGPIWQNFTKDFINESEIPRVMKNLSTKKFLNQTYVKDHNKKGINCYPITNQQKIDFINIIFKIYWISLHAALADDVVVKKNIHIQNVTTFLIRMFQVLDQYSNSFSCEDKENKLLQKK